MRISNHPFLNLNNSLNKSVKNVIKKIFISKNSFERPWILRYFFENRLYVDCMFIFRSHSQFLILITKLPLVFVKPKDSVGYKIRQSGREVNYQMFIWCDYYNTFYFVIRCNSWCIVSIRLWRNVLIIYWQIISHNTKKGLKTDP